ncbi:metalloregulator ArsR/SmtB family transcription factor [Corynebacterium genitalium ATCC 33030]|uniref:ArsR/SmtB family transcription factor n=1 Tax=Corynebacterium TaxID=1716 RepID=UPI000A05E007|nr:MULTISPECIES: metalloregulator ArsR/SmtB family transcription factor [Corynebacterium]MCQ4625873.1 helix-turn-helix transcriptional regulator [Corynebacterium sp. CCUG 69979]MCQ4628125.1 helix-turn-helix transcriptional regulator [Corynebacterium sp. CCUG 65737]UUA89083.1 metalloregulator ArsR/SmtB family transcription factor [Corynebacterium genitalium ATCC 33030]
MRGRSDDQSPNVEDLSLTRVLAALSDPLRLGIVQLLADGEERQWGEIDAPVSKSTLSHHMKTLRSAGITRTRDEGTRCFVRLRNEDLEDRFPGLLPSLLGVADTDAIEVGLK